MTINNNKKVYKFTQLSNIMRYFARINRIMNNSEVVNTGSGCFNCKCVTCMHKKENEQLRQELLKMYRILNVNEIKKITEQSLMWINKD